MVLDKFRQIQVDWDIANQYLNSPTVRLVAGGSQNSQLLTVSILSAGKREDLSDVSAMFSWRNMTNGDNGSSLFNPYDVTSGSFKMALPSSMLGVSARGQVIANIVLTKPEPDSFLITSRALSFVIEESAFTSVAFANDEQTNLFQQILQNWEKLPADYSETIKDFESDADSLASSLAANASSVSSDLTAKTNSMNNATSLAGSNFMRSMSLVDSAQDSAMQSNYDKYGKSLASDALETVNDILSDSAAVTLDSLSINTSNASYVESVTTSTGSTVSKPMSSTSGFWTTLKNWIIGLIFDDTTVSKILTFRKGGTGTNAIASGVVKSNGTQLLPAIVGVDYLAPGANDGWKNITFVNGFSAGNTSQPPALFIQGRTALLTGSILFPSVSANTSIVVGYLPTPLIPERIHYLSAYVLENGPTVRITVLTDGSINLRTGSTPISSGLIAIINKDIVLAE